MNRNAVAAVHSAGLDHRPVPVEAGDFEVWVGPNSAEGLRGEFTL